MNRRRVNFIAEDRCVCCGAIIPESRQICWECENKYIKNKGEDSNEKDINCSRLPE